MLETKILSIQNPTIKLDEMSIPETSMEKNASKTGSIKPSNMLGDVIPFVIINGYYLNADTLQYFKLDYTSFQPTLSITFKIIDGVFMSSHFPCDGDLVSVYIRAKNKEFKPIRNDFIIQSITTNIDYTNFEGNNQIFNIFAILHIPKIYSERLYYLNNKTSYDSLLDVSNYLQLGFSTNETQTNDKMNWLQPYETNVNFIKHLTDYSYKDDNSFFTSFIDPYYNLNFINVNNQILKSPEIDEGITDEFLNTDLQRTHRIYDDISTLKQPLILTNFEKAGESPFKITAYSLNNNSGYKNTSNGYKRYIQYYDSKEKKYIENFLMGLNTEGVSDKIILRGRPNEDNFKHEIKYKYFGILNENMHDNYYFAMMQNYQNMEELDKITLNIKLSHANFNLIKFLPINVIIFNRGNVIAKNIQTTTTDEKEKSKGGASIDRFLSGNYIILDYYFQYDNISRKIQQYLKLGRREWNYPIRKKQ